jgi:hypothetical protein
MEFSARYVEVCDLPYFSEPEPFYLVMRSRPGGKVENGR